MATIKVLQNGWRRAEGTVDPAAYHHAKRRTASEVDHNVYLSY